MSWFASGQERRGFCDNLRANATLGSTSGVTGSAGVSPARCSAGSPLNLDSLTLTDVKISNFTVAAGGAIQLTWDSVPGQTYQVQYSTQLPAVSWSNLGSIITATNVTTTTPDSMDGNVSRYYRVRTQ